ncbi:MAG: hypothetical protein RMM06_10400 [Armatimonadota bacterium]|nr:hypothetical protein [Armatimonadota bacterium]
MSRRLCLLLLAALCGVWAVSWVLAQSPEEVMRLPVVFTEREAVMVAPREFVAPPEVVDGRWSSDGRYALVVRRTPRLAIAEEEPERVPWSLLLWDRQQRRAREVWKGEVARGRELVRRIEWMAGAPVALLELHAGMRQDEAGMWGEVTAHARLHAPTGTLKILGEPDRWRDVMVSPVKPFALLLGEEGYQVLRADGLLTPLVPYERLFGGSWDARPRWMWLMGSWTKGGDTLWVTRLRREAGDSRELIHYLVDPVAVTVTPAREKPPLHSPQPSRHGLEVAIVPAELRSGEDKAQVRSAWLVGKKGRVLVCADVQVADLSPAGDAVWYVSQGAAWIAPLRKLSRQQYEALYREKLQETAVSYAKQIGLALMMYVQDFDETFPPNTGDLQWLLLPYLKDSRFFNLPGTNFFYLMNMETLGSIQTPSETMVGYIQTPYGRAVIWAVGHVTWQSF